MPIVSLDRDPIKTPPDLLSPVGQVMNDDIGRISASLMNAVRESLGLLDLPSAIQGRCGSAKGMWILDLEDRDQVWIELTPSQRTWKCDWAHPDHRMLELMSCSTERRPAQLNAQFIPILHDRAIDSEKMRLVIERLLEDGLKAEIDTARESLKRPESFRKWFHDMSGMNGDRASSTTEIPFLGGLPREDADAMSFLVDGGFHPLRQSYLLDLAVKALRARWESLRPNVKIEIGRSTHCHMVVDFLGVLRPNEIHLGFSTRFRSGSGEGDCHDLDGIHVLVGRCPAHLPSDIQKVRAVFRPELRHLKDVIIFPSLGDFPLAGKLSGGDYDGDIAWVCWEPEIVSNFRPMNDVPPKPDLSLRRISASFGSLGSIDERIKDAFTFAFGGTFLGQATTHKESFCYKTNSIRSVAAVSLSWLLSDLVDQAKTGVMFSRADWDRFCRILNVPRRLEKPAYARKELNLESTHVLDQLFVRANDYVHKEMEGLSKMGTDQTQHYDAELSLFWNDFFATMENKLGWAALREQLCEDLRACGEAWQQSNKQGRNYRIAVCTSHARWRSIRPLYSPEQPELEMLLDRRPDLGPPEFALWELLKASITFKFFLRRGSSLYSPKFAWRMAGRQLQFIMAMMSARQAPAPVPVTAAMYCALQPNKRRIKALVTACQKEEREMLERGLFD